MLVLLALRVPKMVINAISFEFYSLPVNLSFLHPAGVVIGALYLSVKRFHVPRNALVTAVPLLILAAYIFFYEGFKSAVIGQQYGRICYSMAWEIVFFLIVYFLCSLHLNLYGHRFQFKSILERIIILIILTQSVIVLMVSLGISIPFIAHDGVSRRNGIAILANLLFFLSYLSDNRNGKKNTKSIAFFFLALFSCLLNHSIGSLITLFCLLGWRVSTYFFTAAQLLRISLVFLVITLVASSSVYYFAVSEGYLPQVNIDSGIGDDTARVRIISQESQKSLVKPVISITSRSATNYFLVKEFFKYPVLGSGYELVFGTRIYGYMSHSYWLFILVAYGFIGASLVLIFFRLYSNSFQSKNSGKVLAGILIFMACVLTLSNDLFLWIALLLVLAKQHDTVSSIAIPASARSSG